MIEIVFIRHGKTPGNLKSRYIGTTDEELCREGIEETRNNLHKNIYPVADIIFTSPMKRCIQTAEIIYPGLCNKLYIIDEFKEIDFGKFEGKNYLELNGNREYQKWIDSGGTKKFPGGEDMAAFARRCVTGFKKSLVLCMELQEKKELRKDAVISFIVHGGTIMSIMEALANGSYFDYQCGNGYGYKFKLNSFCISDFENIALLKNTLVKI